jgi:hypothetical protein
MPQDQLPACPSAAVISRNFVLTPPPTADPWYQERSDGA